MRNQQQKVYKAERQVPRTHNIFPNVKKLNARKIDMVENQQLVFYVSKSGVIEKAYNPKKDKFEVPEFHNEEREIDGANTVYVIKYFGNYYRRGNAVYFNQDEINYAPLGKFDDTDHLGWIWDQAERLAKEYPDHKLEIDMSYFVSNGRNYVDKENIPYKRADAYIDLKVIEMQNVNYWDRAIHNLRTRHYTVKNMDYKTTKEIETLVIKRVKEKIFSSYFYKAYFDNKITFTIPNSYNGTSHYKKWTNEIVLKKWSDDMTLLHELAHQGKGCSNYHSEYFTSQMLMLVGQFISHKQQIKLLKAYQENDVHWLGNFFHTQECLTKAGISESDPMYKNAKGNRTCANGSTRMTKKFKNWLTEENRKVKV